MHRVSTYWHSTDTLRHVTLDSDSMTLEWNKDDASLRAYGLLNDNTIEWLPPRQTYRRVSFFTESARLEPGVLRRWTETVESVDDLDLCPPVACAPMRRLDVSDWPRALCSALPPASRLWLPVWPSVELAGVLALRPPLRLLSIDVVHADEVEWARLDVLTCPLELRLRPLNRRHDVWIVKWFHQHPHLVRVISCFWRRVFEGLARPCDALLPLEPSAYKLVVV
jgi:hypothetical protein